MSSTDRPTFSIVLPVRNGVRTIAQCLESVICQTSLDWELVVMDGASTDGTLAIISRYADKIAHLESEADRGICHAWNKSLEHVRGAWIVFLGADDRLASADVLARAIALLPDPAEAAVAYGIVNPVNAGGRVVEAVGRPWAEISRAFFDHNTIPHQGVFHHTSLFARNGRFDESFRICGDYELLMRELRYRPPVFMPGLVVAEVGSTGVSMRPESSYLATREMRRAQRRHGVVSAPAWRSFRLLRATAFEGLRRTAGLGFARRMADAYKRMTSRQRKPSQ